MSSYNADNLQTSEDVERLIRETKLCKPCSALFCEGGLYGEYYPHHDSYTSLCQSSEAGCRLCEILKDRWDCELSKQVTDPDWHSRAQPTRDELSIDICSRQGLICTMFFEVRPYEHKFRSSKEKIPIPFSNQEYMHTAMQWFESCVGSTHPQCHTYRRQRGRELARPRRLLYFPSHQTEEVQLVEVQKEQTYRYATLSHRWGTPEPPKLSCNSDRDRKISYETMIKGISTSDLPRIFREALQIIYHFNIEHLWIDSLCINQDSDVDGRKREWEEEAVKIGDIYTGGVFNIAAISSKNSDGTLFPERKEYFAPVLRDSFCSHVRHKSWIGSRLVRLFADTDAEFESHVLSAELLSRGWVYQEIILAPAILFCTAQQMWWLCHTGRYCQNESITCGTYHGFARTSLARARETIDFSRGFSGSVESWMYLLRLYSKTSVTFKDDRLAAIAGLSKVFQSAFPGCVEHDSYNSGFWSTNVIFQLTWSRGGSSIPLNRYTAQNFYIPSWSPVSCQNETVYLRTLAQYSQLPIEWDMNTSDLDSFGRAKSIEQCILHLRGVLSEMTLGIVLSAGDGGYKAWPPAHPISKFDIRWDNQAEIDLAEKASLENGLRALILYANVLFGSVHVSGILLRPFRTDGSLHSDQWVRCGYLDHRTRREDAEIFKALQLTRYGIMLDSFKYGDFEGRCTHTVSDLEDIYLV